MVVFVRARGEVGGKGPVLLPLVGFGIAFGGGVGVGGEEWRWCRCVSSCVRTRVVGAGEPQGR